MNTSADSIQPSMPTFPHKLVLKPYDAMGYAHAVEPAVPHEDGDGAEENHACEQVALVESDLPAGIIHAE